MKHVSWVAVAIILGVGLASARGFGASDQRAEHERHRHGCSNATLRGAYGIQIQGTRPAKPGGPLESVIGVVIRNYDGEGQFSQVDNVKGATSGTVPDREGFGTYQVNRDCTAVVHLEPGPGILIEERLVIVDEGREILSATMLPPPVMVTGVSRKIEVN
jgi:hypothetical protein